MLKSLLDAATSDVTRYANGQLKLFFRLMSAESIQEICEKAKHVFALESTLLRIESPLVIVGDIHGHVLDLFRILSTYGMPDKTRYLFLGDIVDRGEFSIESILIVLLMKIIWPDNVFVIRGNHEFEFLCSQCGFCRQLDSVYPGQVLLDYFLPVFCQIPVAAVVDGSMFCVHGGLGANLASLSQIEQIQRPVTDFGNDLIDSLFWSDPTDLVPNYMPSNRGTGYLFGSEATKKFLEDNDLKVVVRAHECVIDGTRVDFDGKCITVFSASNYCGLIGNRGAVIEVRGKDDYITKCFPPLNYLKRMQALFDRPNKEEEPISVKEAFSQSLSHKTLSSLISASQQPITKRKSHAIIHKPVVAPSQIRSCTNRPAPGPPGRVKSTSSLQRVFPKLD